MNGRRLASEGSGGGKWSRAGIAPGSEPDDSSTMARARFPRGRCGRLAQPIPTAIPRTMNASASTFCMNAMKLFMATGSGRAHAVHRKDFAGEQAHELWIPLPAGSAIEDRDRLVLAEPAAVWTVVGEG